MKKESCCRKKRKNHASISLTPSFPRHTDALSYDELQRRLHNARINRFQIQRRNKFSLA